MKLKLKAIAVTIFIFSAFSKNTFAEGTNELTIPTFPNCAQPQGITKVVYSNGVHGIPGRTEVYTGKDAVYTLTEDTLTQCFCAPSDRGIQSNWWKVPNLSISDIEYLEGMGWIYIPNGALWGLEEAPYVAKNTEYDCGPQENEEEDDGDDNDDDDDEEDGGRGGILLGYSTSRLGTGGQILGLAATGDVMQVLGVLTAAGAITATGAYIFKKREEEKKSK